MPKSSFNIVRRLACVVMLGLLGIAAPQHASAFTVFGPLESWQTPILDYGTRYYYGNDIELGGPKNYNQGSRLNVPVLTYAFDYTFLTYFGAKGEAAVDAAMNEFNRLPSATPLHSQLSRYLTQDNQAINYTAQAMVLTDLKSVVMSLMLEHMGLEGESHVWDLRLRNPTPVTCVWGYDVINRNYDPVSYLPTAYVNGVQSGYQIWDGCVAGVEVADAIEVPIQDDDPAHYVYTAVATRYGQQVGGYYLGLTRDDVGGLSYLYQRGNLAWESMDSNSIVSGYASSWNPVSTNNIISVTNGFTGLTGGVEHVSYVKVAYDSLLGSAFPPRSYKFSIPVVTNGGFQMVQVTRTITKPDIIFAAADLTVVPNAATPDNYPNPYERTFNFITSTLSTTAATNGVVNAVISPQEIITFNDVTGVYFNESTSFLTSDQFLLYPTLLWGSFDGSTNAPTVYPSTISTAQLLQQILSSGSNASLGVYNPISLLGTNTNSTVTSTLNP